MALLDGRCAVLATLKPESLESFAGATGSLRDPRCPVVRSAHLVRRSVLDCRSDWSSEAGPRGIAPPSYRGQQGSRRS